MKKLTITLAFLVLVLSLTTVSTVFAEPVCGVYDVTQVGAGYLAEDPHVRNGGMVYWDYDELGNTYPLYYVNVGTGDEVAVHNSTTWWWYDVQGTNVVYTDQNSSTGFYDAYLYDAVTAETINVSNSAIDIYYPILLDDYVLFIGAAPATLNTRVAFEYNVLYAYEIATGTTYAYNAPDIANGGGFSFFALVGHKNYGVVREYNMTESDWDVWVFDASDRSLTAVSNTPTESESPEFLDNGFLTLYNNTTEKYALVDLTTGESMISPSGWITADGDVAALSYYDDLAGTRRVGTVDISAGVTNPGSIVPISGETEFAYFPFINDGYVAYEVDTAIATLRSTRTDVNYNYGVASKTNGRVSPYNAPVGNQSLYFEGDTATRSLNTRVEPGNTTDIRLYDIATTQTNNITNYYGTVDMYSYLSFQGIEHGVLAFVTHDNVNHFQYVQVYTCNEQPADFALTSPPNDVIITNPDTIANIVWTESVGANGYFFSLQKVVEGIKTDVVHGYEYSARPDQICANGTCSLSVHLHALEDGLYVWNVNAGYNLAAKSAFNGPFSFLVDTGADGNLLINEGFEYAKVNGWNTNANAKIKQNKPDKTFSLEGDYAMMLKVPATLPRGKAKQLVDLTNLTLGLGQTLTIDGSAKTNGETRLKLIAKHAEGKDKRVVKLLAGNGYAAFNDTLALTDDVVKLKVVLKGISGKSFYDGLSLTVADAPAALMAPDAQTIPLPEAPDGFRR